MNSMLSHFVETSFGGLGVSDDQNATTVVSAILLEGSMALQLQFGGRDRGVDLCTGDDEDVRICWVT